MQINHNQSLFQEYEEEISSLSSELASARDQNGVFLSTEKYQALMDQMNRQKIAIDQEKVKEMFDLIFCLPRIRHFRRL